MFSMQTAVLSALVSGKSCHPRNSARCLLSLGVCATCQLGWVGRLVLGCKSRSLGSVEGWQPGSVSGRKGSVPVLASEPGQPSLLGQEVPYSLLHLSQGSQISPVVLKLKKKKKY